MNLKLLAERRHNLFFAADHGADTVSVADHASDSSVPANEPIDDAPGAGDPVPEAQTQSGALEEKISHRARAIWEEEGRPDGRAEEHWARAQRELENR